MRGQLWLTQLTQLTRRPDKEPHRAGGWFVYYGDVRVGHIGKRAGVPTHAPQWVWNCGFYPGCDPGQSTNGTAETFEQARAGFEEAWRKLLVTRTEAHFELWRQSRDFHAWKDRMHDERLPMPTQRESGRARCFCGEEITNAGVPAHIQAAHRGIGANDSHSSDR
ncbi:hypothetical protein ABIF91_001699 [Bradyrhizobium sp. USDA 241]